MSDRRVQLAAATALAAAGALAAAAAADFDHERAAYDYLLYCQGCHTPDGTGGEGVPRVKGHIGYFLNDPEGREFLVRVPGAATSILDDQRLADVLNWMVLTFGGDSVPQDFEPYTSVEIGRLRQSPLNEIQRRRQDILARVRKGSSRTERSGVE